MDGKSLVGQVVIAIELYPFHKVLGGDGVDLPSAVERINEGTQADGGDGSRFVGGNVPVHMGNDSLGQVIPFDLIVQSQFL